VEHRIDAWLMVALAAILGASSATLHAVSPVLGSQLLLRQLLWGIVGLLLVWTLSRVQLNVWIQLAPIAYGLGILSLVAVLLLGEVRSGSRAWFALGPLTLQPSEFARVGTILLVAAWLGRRRSNRLNIAEALVVGGIVGGAALLVALEPDLGVTLTYLPVMAAALWLGGLPPRAWLVVLLLGVVAAGAAWQFGLKPYQKERVRTVLDPGRDPYGAGYQVQQSKIAVGSGGPTGQGLGQGSQSLLRFLPAQHTDFVFAVWAEATGLVGTTGLLLAYLLLLFRIGAAALNAESRHGLVLAVLIGVWLAFQVVFNVGMVLGWLPTTGITLPLFSYGGSSLLSTCLALGIVHSVWCHRLVYQ
jgi:rod shape determining protein RodA